MPATPTPPAATGPADANADADAGPLPPPRHDLPVPALPAASLDLPAGAAAADLALIERLRRDVRRLDFAPLTDAELATRVARWPSAVASSALSGNPLDAADHALRRMLWEERMPSGADVPVIVRFASERHAARASPAD